MNVGRYLRGEDRHVGTARVSFSFAGQLYQLHSSRHLERGAYVAVNGPWDAYGIVLACRRQDDGRFLNVIRGVKRRDLTPACQF